MTSRAHHIAKAVCLFLLFITCTARAQLSFHAGPANIDSFPIVRIPISTTNGNLPAGIASSDFVVTEDGAKVSATLEGCSGSPDAAIALVIDTSSSMRESIGYGKQDSVAVPAFNEGVSSFLRSLSPDAQVAVVPFADSASYSYPQLPPLFYRVGVPKDTSALIYSVNSFRYDGAGTDVTSGIYYGAGVLATSLLHNQAIVLITDDNISAPDTVLNFLLSSHISLYVMQVTHSRTRNESNAWVAEQSGGAYYSAYDSTLYSQDLSNIAHLIESEHCILRYRSGLGCPWWQKHDVQISLTFNKEQATQDLSYELRGSFRDSIPPTLTATADSYTTRTLRAYDPFPCQTGLRSTKAIASNFASIRSNFSVDSASELLVVLDSLRAASADYFAIDSAGNEGRLHVTYQPKPDTLAPDLTVDSSIAGVFLLTIRETRPWDRGIATVAVSGLVNIVQDSLRLSRDSGTAYFHRIDPKRGIYAAIAVTDSAGNVSQITLHQPELAGDTLPPILTQPPLTEPRKTISAIATEARMHDRGIENLSTTEENNCTLRGTHYLSSQLANLDLNILDSLYPASAIVTARDSAENLSTLRLTYSPLPDVKPPFISFVKSDSQSYAFTITEDSAWDRGIAKIEFQSDSNAIETKVHFADARHAAIDIEVTDALLNASFTLIATDSAGNSSRLLTEYAASKPHLPLENEVIDFGTVAAPSFYTQKAFVTNTSGVFLNVTIAPPTGDDSVFSLTDKTTFPLSNNNTEVLHFTFHPKLVGSWKAVYSEISNGQFIGTITLLGQSAGTIGLALDTVLVAHPGLSDTLRLSIDATPKPINLDTIQFTLRYDQDVIALGDFVGCAAGALDTGVCLYDTKWLDANHTMGQLIRKTKRSSAILSYGRTVLRIPFQTYLAITDSTIIHFASVSSGSLTSFAASDGLVKIVGDTCGTTIGRSVMRGDNAIQIDGIAPNPASSIVKVFLISQVASAATASLIDLQGNVVRTAALDLKKGSQRVILSDLPPSGTYELRISIQGVTRASRLIKIVK